LTDAEQAMLQTFNIEHIMNKQATFITYCTFSKDFTLVVVTIGYMSILIEMCLHDFWILLVNGGSIMD